MLFKTALLFGFAASVFAAPEAHVEARGLVRLLSPPTSASQSLRH